MQKHKIKYDHIIFEENKEELDYNIFIDDSPVNAKKIFDSGKSILLYNQPWNVNVTPQSTESAHLIRVYDLDHTIYILEKQ